MYFKYIDLFFIIENFNIFKFYLIFLIWKFQNNFMNEQFSVMNSNNPKNVKWIEFLHSFIRIFLNIWIIRMRVKISNSQI